MYSIHSEDIAFLKLLARYSIYCTFRSQHRIKRGCGIAFPILCMYENNKQAQDSKYSTDGNVLRRRPSKLVTLTPMTCHIHISKISSRALNVLVAFPKIHQRLFVSCICLLIAPF